MANLDKGIGPNGLLYIWQKIQNTFVTKVTGKGLSTNDYTDAEKAKVANALTSHQDISGKADKASNPTAGNFASLDANGNLADSGKKASDFLTSHQNISGKADKVANATNGNFAALDSNGNLTDSGHKHGDYLTSHQDISGLAPKASPTFTGTPEAPTAAAGTNTTQIATTAFVKTALDNALSGITSISLVIVQTLPASGTAGTIYFVPNSHGTLNAYDEYVWLNNAWEFIGQASIDLSGYLQEGDIVELTNAEIDTIIASA